MRASLPGRLGFLLLGGQLLLSPLVFSPWTVEEFEFGKVLLLQLVALSLLGCGLEQLVKRVEGGRSPRPGRGTLRCPITWGVAALAGSAVLSTSWSIHRPISLFGANESFFGLLTALAYAVVFFATRALVPTGGSIRALLWSVPAAVAAATTYAILQLGALDPMSWYRTAEYAGAHRVFSTMGHPNFLGGYLVTAFPIVLYFLVRCWRRRRRVAFLALCATLAGSGVAIVGTLSRGAWLAWLVSMTTMAVASWLALGRARSRYRARTLAGVAAAGVLLGALVILTGGGGRLDSMEQRLRNLGQLGNEPRTYIWSAAWQMFRDHPIAGLGLDCFGLAFEQYRPPEYWHVEWNGGPARAHSELLQVAATQGIVGLVGLVLLSIGLAVAARRALKRSASPDDRFLVVALAAGLAGFYAQALVGFAVAGSTILMITLAAILSRMAGFGEEDTATRRPSPALPSRWGIGWAISLAAVLACLLFIGSSVVGSGEHSPPPARVLSTSIYVLALLAMSFVAYRGAIEAIGEPGADNPTSNGAAPPMPAFSWRLAAGVSRIGIVLLVGAGLWWTVYVPFSADWACRRGLRLNESGAIGESLALLRTAASLRPARDLYWVELGSAYERAARDETDGARRRMLLEDARAAHGRALQTTPLSGYLHMNLARVLAELARIDDGNVDPSQAFASFDSGLALDPHNAHLLREGARAALLLGDRERARDYAERACQLYEYYSPCRLQLGILAMSERRWEAATAELEAAIRGRWYGEESSLAVTWTNLASCWIALSRYPAAIRAAEHAVEIEPAQVQGWLAKAGAHEMLASGPETDSPENHRRQAIDAYRTALRLSPSDAGARAALERLEAPAEQ